jgi:hypothetical protein
MIHNIGTVSALEKRVEDFLLGQEIATNDQIRDVWGKGMSTSKIDVDQAIEAFASGFGNDRAEVANRFRKLPSRPRKKLFENFDLHYSVSVLCGCDPFEKFLLVKNSILEPSTSYFVPWQFLDRLCQLGLHCEASAAKA